MINDIRIQASKILQLQDNTSVLKINITPQKDNVFGDLLLDKSIKPEENENPNGSFMSLGIPAGFNIDYSLLEEMENQG